MLLQSDGEERDGPGSVVGVKLRAYDSRQRIASRGAKETNLVSSKDVGLEDEEALVRLDGRLGGEVVCFEMDSAELLSQGKYFEQLTSAKPTNPHS